MLLAQELIEKIIDNLESTPRALTACSLTCRDWYPLAQRYIHSKFIYDGTDACQARITAYLHRPDLAELVRVLVVDPGREDRRLRWRIKMGPIVELELVPFPKVEELTLLYITWENRSPSFREYITTQFPLVKKLHLGGPGSGVRIEDFATLISMIRSFPKITSLGIQAVTLNNSYYYNRGWFNPEIPRPEEVELSHTTESALETVAQMSKADTLALSLDHNSAAVWEFEGYVRKLGMQLLAQDVRLTCESPVTGMPNHDREVLPRLLKMFSQNVQRLELDFRRWHCSGDTSVIFPFLEFSDLHHLSVHICPVGPDGLNVKWFPDFLSSVHSTHPYQLTLRIRALDIFELKRVGFSRIDAVLSAKADAELKQVVLAVSVGHRRLISWEEVYRYIVGELPEVIRLGIVEFVYM